MKKRIMVMVLALGMALCGCGGNDGIGEGTASGLGAASGIAGGAALNLGDSGTGAENSDENVMLAGDGKAESGTVKLAGEDGGASGSAGETGKPEEGAGTRVTQSGPYGEISVILPDGWKYEAFPMDSDELINGDYGIHFCPEGVEKGFIELVYIDFFGVCGTGLAQEDAEIAGSPANIGTFDGHAYWDFISFREQNDGVVALTYWVEEWWEEYGDAVTEILDTLSFERSKKEGGAYVFKEESENREIGLYFFLKDITPTGATLVYNQFDIEAPTGQLQDGDDYMLERYQDGKWENVPMVVEGDYGFHDIAYTIPNEEITERELSWEWLYGQLSPGEYRIGKSILDFRKTADYDKYVIYAYFILE